MCWGLLLQPDSKFAQAYAKGVPKKEYWDPVYEDSMNLIAKLPGIAALIYRNTYFGGKKIPHDSSLDWAANLAHQMGEPGFATRCTIGCAIQWYSASRSCWQGNGSGHAAVQESLICFASDGAAVLRSQCQALLLVTLSKGF